jgi:hypothetical protein
MISKEDMYKFHQENVLALDEGLDDISANIKNGIVRKHLAKSQPEIKKAKRYVLIQMRILSGLTVSWSEVIIKRLYYEPNAYTDLQIEKLHGLNLQQKWEFALKVAFCKAYNIRNPNIFTNPLFNGIEIETQTTISRTARNRYKDIMNLIKDELLPAINIRNKVQHGEWIKAFEPPNSLTFSPDLTRDINKENIVSLQTKINQFRAIYQLIHDLAVSKEGNNATTFERDFDKNYDRIESNRRLFRKRKPIEYEKDLIGRYERGVEWKERNKPQVNVINRIINRIIG